MKSNKAERQRAKSCALKMKELCAKKHKWPLHATKARRQASEPPPTLDCSPLRLISDSDFQNGEIVSLCCSKPPSVWYFVTPAMEA